MAQFSVYKNPNTSTRSRVPFLMDVQSELLSALDTRWVVPLVPLASLRGKPMRIVSPVIEIDGKSFAMMTPELAGVPKKMLGGFVADVSTLRTELVAALDMMVTGL